MGRTLEDAVVHSRAALAVMVGALVAIVLPTLLMTAADGSGTAVTVLVLALVVLVGIGMRWSTFATRCEAPAPPTGEGPPPVLPGRVTDPVHHPLRPRAPGLA